MRSDRPMIILALASLSIVLLVLSGCGGTAPTSVPTVPRPTLITGTPTIIIPPTRTPYPSSGPTLDHSFQNAFAFAQNAPKQIGRFTLNQSQSYADKGGRGAVLIYETANKLQLSATLWLTDNTNDAVDRFNVETGLIKAEKISVPVGDEAIVSPANRTPGLRPGQNGTVWGEMRFRNTVLILYPSPELMDKVSDFSKDEAVDFLTKLLAAMPNK